MDAAGPSADARVSGDASAARGCARCETRARRSAVREDVWCGSAVHDSARAAPATRPPTPVKPLAVGTREVGTDDGVMRARARRGAIRATTQCIATTISILSAGERPGGHFRTRGVASPGVSSPACWRWLDAEDKPSRRRLEISRRVTHRGRDSHRCLAHPSSRRAFAWAPAPRRPRSPAASPSPPPRRSRHRRRAEASSRAPAWRRCSRRPRRSQRRPRSSVSWRGATCGSAGTSPRAGSSSGRRSS